MQNLKFKAQPPNAFFATVNQMCGGNSRVSTTAKRAVIKSLSTVQTTKQCSAVVGSWEEPPNIWLTVAKNAFVGWASNFRVRMLLKGAVMFCRVVNCCKNIHWCMQKKELKFCVKKLVNFLYKFINIWKRKPWFVFYVLFTALHIFFYKLVRRIYFTINATPCL